MELKDNRRKPVYRAEMHHNKGIVAQEKAREIIPLLFIQLINNL
jgi:hypothetical protein